MLHRCLSRVAGLTRSFASQASKRSGNITGLIMKGCGRLGTRLSMTGRATLQMLLGIWQSALKKIRSMTGRHKQ